MDQVTEAGEDARPLSGMPQGLAEFREHLRTITSPGRASSSVARDRSVDKTSEGTLEALWERSELSADAFADEVAAFWGRPRLALPHLLALTPALDQFSTRFLTETFVFPGHTSDGEVVVVVADPSDATTLHAVEIALGARPRVAVASFEDIATALTERLGQSTIEPVDPRTPARDDDVESLRDLASGAPVVRAVNELLERAVDLRASDIHIEPFRAVLTVRMRIDGLLRVVPDRGGAPPSALVSRIKILAGLDIAERRLPQDGAARLRVGRSEIDIRVATMPTHHGEAVVIRLLPRERGILDVGKLGLSLSDETKLARMLEMPHGLMVVTGPTGSGKTTTLATMLSRLNEPTRKILTIEDPVEYEINGIVQSQVRPSIGLTFAAALRSFVRQDPDVIMVGEVRDSETAHIAIHAALTGHLVLTTLHTETAAAAVPRLLDLGVEPFLLKSTLRAVIAQRLVRVLCERCRTRRHLTTADLTAEPRFGLLGFAPGDPVSEPVGCERCQGTGFRGRVGVFEVLMVSEIIRQAIGQRADAVALDQAARHDGMTTMVEDAVAKCRAGMTAAAEVFRITAVR